VLEEENRSSYYMLLFSIKFLEDFAIQITAKKKKFQWMEYAAGENCLLNLFRSRQKTKCRPYVS
jgi:hypothetical protein